MDSIKDILRRDYWLRDSAKCCQDGTCPKCQDKANEPVPTDEELLKRIEELGT